VFGGMILATFVGVLFIGPLFVVAETITEKLRRRRAPAAEAQADATEMQDRAPERDTE
jgi:uncharacterized membrane protein YGL010W